MKKLIVLHGALGSQSQLTPLKEILEESFEVYGFDFSGHGGMPFSEYFSMAQFSKELREFIVNNDLMDADVFGYSMGGYAALNLIKDNPDSFGKLVTLGTKFDWTIESASKEIRHLNPEKVLENVPKFAAILEKRHTPIDWKQNMNKTAQMMLDLGGGECINKEGFEKVSNSVLLLLAEQDTMVSKEETELVNGYLQNGEFKILNNSKHPIEQVDMKSLASIITAFMA